MKLFPTSKWFLLIVASMLVLCGCDDGRPVGGPDSGTAPMDGSTGDGGGDSGSGTVDGGGVDAGSGVDAGDNVDGGRLDGGAGECTPLCAGADTRPFRCTDSSECCTGLSCVRNEVAGESFCMPDEAPDSGLCPAEQPSLSFSCEHKGLVCTYGGMAMLCHCIGWVPVL